VKRPLVIVGCIVLAVVCLGSSAEGGAAASSQPGGAARLLRPIAEFDPYSITRLICEGLPDSALSILEGERHSGVKDPMVHLLRARTLRDKLSDEDEDKSLIKRDCEAILAELDRAIAICDEALDKSDSDPLYRYYRGRAYLGKAQINTLTRSYWGAGRSASKGKGDLEKYLKIVPDNPDAQGDLGAFLYFADTLPGVIKLVSKLLFIPGGDREEGLRLLYHASTQPGVFQIDYQIAVAAIDLLFEGRLEQGVDAMLALADRYPYYTRLIEPFGVLAPLYPRRLREFQRIEDKTVERRLARGDESIDWNLIKRLHLHRAYANMFFGSPKTAVLELTTLIENPPARPDWMLPLAIINRGHLYAKRDDTEAAREAFSFVAMRDDMKHYHNLANGLIESLDPPWKTVDLNDLEFIGSIYDRRLDVAAAGLDRYEQSYGKDALYYFYLGELKSFANDFVAAAQAYAACLDEEATGGDESYQMFASLRLAEIHGHELRYDRAEVYIKEATEYTHAGYLFDFMIHSRRRYYKLLKDGTLTTPPTMLLYQSARRSGSPSAQ